MFERYTERARRIIFFARYEASQFGSPSIESEHLLLGLLREDRSFALLILKTQASLDSIRYQVEAHAPKRPTIGASVDLPLTTESKRILAYANEEAENLGTDTSTRPISCSACSANRAPSPPTSSSNARSTSKPFAPPPL